jgi:hypothetical protein
MKRKTTNNLLKALHKNRHQIRPRVGLIAATPDR